MGFLFSSPIPPVALSFSSKGILTFFSFRGFFHKHAILFRRSNRGISQNGFKASKSPLFFQTLFLFFFSTPSSSPFFLGFFLFPFLRSCLKPFRAPSLVFFRLTRVQSMFSRNPHPLRPTGFSFLFFSPVYLLLKLRSALKEIPHKISFYASQYIIEYNSLKDMKTLIKT